MRFRQANLASKQRDPANDIMEARLRRLALQSLRPPEDAVLEARRLFSSLRRPMWQTVDAMLPTDGSDASDILTKFRVCLKHRLHR